MARIIASRVKETTTTTGSGDKTVGGAVTGMRAFSSVCSVGDSFEYIEDDGAGNWEYVLGIYSAANTIKPLITLASSNANAPVNWGAGAKNIWIDAGSHTLKFRPENGFFAYFNQLEVAANIPIGGFHQTVNGGSFSGSPTPIAGIIGGITVNLGTTTTARAALVGQDQGGVTSVVALGSGVARYKGRLQLLQLSNATDTYSTRIGMNGTSTADPVAGIYFRYNHAVNGGRWEAVTRQNNTETATDTGVSGQITAGSTCEIYDNADSTAAYFFIDGALVATNTTNIPSGAGSTQRVGYGVAFNRSAGTAALIPATIYFQQFEYFYTTPF